MPNKEQPPITCIGSFVHLDDCVLEGVVVGGKLSEFVAFVVTIRLILF